MNDIHFSSCQVESTLSLVLATECKINVFLECWENTSKSGLLHEVIGTYDLYVQCHGYPKLLLNFIFGGKLCL